MSSARQATTHTPAAVLVVNYFSADQVSAVVRDLGICADPRRLHVSVLDNSCNEEEFDRLTRLTDGMHAEFLSFTVTRSRSNSGYATGNNDAYRAVSHLSFGSVVVINPDVRLADGALDLLIDEVEANRDAIAVPRSLGHGVVLDGRAAMSLWTGRSRQLKVDERPPSRSILYPGGHCMALSRELWDRAGGFCQDYFLYAEEADLVLRLGITEAQIRSVKSSVISHEQGGTTKTVSGQKSLITHYHAARSRVLLLRYHRSLRMYMPTMILFRLAWSIAHLPFNRGILGTSLRGLAAGLSPAKPPPRSSRKGRD